MSSPTKTTPLKSDGSASKKPRKSSQKNKTAKDYVYGCRKAYMYIPGHGLLMQVVDGIDTDEVEVMEL